MLAINWGEDLQTVRDFVAQRGLTLPVVRDDKGEVSARAFGAEVLATCLVVGADGRVAWRGIGADETAIRSALEKKGR